MPTITKRLPDYKRPFDQSDFRGYFRWTDRLSEQLGGSLYHGCHGDELECILDAGELILRSEWQLRLPEHGTCTIPGVWTGLNYFHKGNHYGPCLMEFPIGVLSGRNFMVFRRTGEDRHRHFFVQYESRIPIYSYVEAPKGKNKANTIKLRWRNVNPEHYFVKGKNSLSMKKDAIYDIVLTAPLLLTEYKVEGIDHNYCISGKCDGSESKVSHRKVRGIACSYAKKVIGQSPEIQALLDHFPCLVGKQFPLERPEDD